MEGSSSSLGAGDVMIAGRAMTVAVIFVSLHFSYTFAFPEPKYMYNLA